MAVDVYAYFNADTVASLMDAVASITASANFLDLFKVVTILGFLVFVVGMALGKSQDPMEFFRWFMFVMVIQTVLLVPKLDVVVIDRTGGKPPVVRANVPVGLALFASVTSHAGDVLTRMFETVFSSPLDLQFSKNGLLFGNTLLVDTNKATPMSPDFREDLLNFINNCTYYDIAAGRVNQNNLVKSGDVWSEMANTSKSLLTPFTTAPNGSLACDSAYSQLDDRFKAEVQLSLQSRGRALNPGALNDIAAGLLLENQIGSAYATLTGISKSATDMVRQNMALNSLRDSQMISAQRLDATGTAIVSVAQTQAEFNANTNFLVMARIAERAAPAIRNIAEIICYAVFPIIILLMVLAGEHSGKVLKGYAMSLIWIQLIPPLYAVLNFVMLSVTAASLPPIAIAGAPDARITLNNIGQLSQGGLSDLAIAGYMTVLLPMIAWALVKGGEIGGAAIFSQVLAGANSSSTTQSEAVGSGNISQGNVNLDNVSRNNLRDNSFDNAPSVTTGFTRVTDGLGTSTSGADGSFRYQALQSSLPVDATFGQKVSNSLSTDASAKREASKRDSKSASDSMVAGLMSRMEISRGFSSSGARTNSSTNAESSRSGEAINTLTQASDLVSERLGLTKGSKIADQIVGEIGATGSIGVDTKILAVGASVGVKKIDSKESFQNLDNTVSAVKDLLKNKNYAKDNAVSDEYRSSQEYQWGQQNRQESSKAEQSSFSKAKQFTKSAERNLSESYALAEQARVVNESWATSSVSLAGNVADRMKHDGTLPQFLHQYQTDPAAAAKTFSKYLNEILPVAAPTKMGPVTQDIDRLKGQSDELRGKTVDGERERFDASISDQTASSKRGNDNKVLRSGFSEVEVKDTISPVVNDGRKKIEGKIESQNVEVSQGIEETRATTSEDLQRKNQVYGLKGEENPNPKSGRADHDRIHKNIFGAREVKTDKKGTK